MTKRIADILEKFAVGSLLVGLYQQQALAVILGVAGLIACLHVTRRMSMSGTALWLLAGAFMAGLYFYGIYLTRKQN